MNKLKDFESNFLDGDPIDHCGNTQFSAHAAFEVYEFAYERGREPLADMLEVLKSIENDAETIPSKIWDMRNAAIAKAEGKL